jgi:hypothetical protein
MKKVLSALVFTVSAAFALTSEPAGPPPADVSPGIAGMLQKDGVRILNGKNVVMELWFRSSTPTGPANTEDAISLTKIPLGSLLGVARFPQRGADRRGQQIKPGVYTMRLGFFPPNGDHQGVSPQRDFAVLSPAADDKDGNTALPYAALIAASLKGSGTPHPLVFSLWKSEGEFKPGLTQEGEHDTVLQAKIGDTAVSMIVDGKFDH